MPTIPRTIYDLIEFGFNVKTLEVYKEWTARVQSFLQEVSPTEAAQFSNLNPGTDIEKWPLARASQIGLLEGLAAKTEDVQGAMAMLASSSATSVVATPPQMKMKKVF